MNHVLRIAGVVAGLCPLELRPLVECGDIVGHDAVELLQRAARAVLHDERHTAVGREAGNHRRREGQDAGILDVCRLQEYLCHDARCLVWIEEETVDAVALPQSAELPEESLLALAERLQLDDKCGLVGAGAGYEVVALNLLAALYGRVGSEDAVHLVDDLLGACHRCGGRHRDGAEQRAGIFVGHQARLCGEHRAGKDGDAHDDGDAHEQRTAHSLLHAFLILAQNFVVGSVESQVEALHAAHLLLFAIGIVRLQEDGAQSRRQRQGVQC